MRFKQLMPPLSSSARPAAEPSVAAVDPIRALDTAPITQLLATAACHADDALRAAAVRRLAQLVDSGKIDFVSELQGTAGATADASSALLAVAALCKDSAHLERLVTAIVNPPELAALAVEGSSTRIRQQAAQRIDDPDEIDRLLRQVRDRDKSVYRILKAKHDARRAEQERQAQFESDMVAACVSLERFSKHVYDALYVPSFEHFAARWHALEAQAPLELRERARLAIDRCLEVMASQVHERMQQAEVIAQDAARRAAREAALAAAAAAEQARESAAAQAAAEAARQRSEQQRAHTERAAAEALAARQIGSLIAKAHGALRAGHTGPAAAIRRALEARLLDAPPLPPTLVRRVQSLDAKLTDLKEWKDYAAAPKRAELIAEMESLVGSTEPPPALAGKIRDLRAQWKTISKGIVSESQEEWERFDRAAESAYQPCREYFEAQAKLRADNVERRRSVLQRLLAFEGTQQGEQADWRAITQVLREARQEWYGISPVNRAALRPVETEFEAALGRLEERLDGWFAQNVAAKQALIERAQALLAVADPRATLDALRSLQQQWKDVGPAPRGQEQSLWDAFRKHGDAAYQQLQQAGAQQLASLEAARTRAVALCESIEQLATRSGPALHAGAPSLPQWRAEFESLGELPRSDQRRIYDRYERALRRCQAALADQRRRDAGQSMDNLLEAARLIHAYGWAQSHSAHAPEAEALRQAAETFIAGVQQWPKGGAQALKAVWEKAAAAAQTDASGDEKRLRTLCIRAEILARLETPPEDQALRREYQLQRLVQAMGHPQEPDPNELDALSLEWIHIGPIEGATYATLLQRLLRCRRH
jgi:hypothetical protein